MDSDRRPELFSGEKKFSGRIISRNSSVGYSSRIYYYRSSDGIPFNWEMQPGTPKEPQKEDTLPPISPPPAVLSLGLPKPRIEIVDDPKPFKLRLFKFWKQGKRSHGNNNSKKLDRADIYYSNCEMRSSDDGEFMASPRRMSSSSSSSSSAFSFSNGSTSPSRGSSVNRYYGCSPLHFSSFRLGVSRSRLR